MNKLFMGTGFILRFAGMLEMCLKFLVNHQTTGRNTKYTLPACILYAVRVPWVTMQQQTLRRPLLLQGLLLYQTITGRLEERRSICCMSNGSLLLENPIFSYARHLPHRQGT